MGTFRLAAAAFIVLLSYESAAADWAEYQTEHFILDTDASRGEAETMMATLEKARAADVSVLAGGELDFAGHIRVIAPASRGMFLDIAGDWTAAFYTHGAYGEPVILTPIKAFENEPETIAHELAHAVSYYLFPEQRRWFTEGLAEFVQTVAARQSEANTAAGGSRVVRGSNTGGAVGGVPAGYGAAYLRDASLTIPSIKLLKWNGVEDPVTPWRFHAASWMLYHYLWNERSKALADLQKRLLDGESWNKAWMEAFPDLDPASDDQMRALDFAISNYRRRGRFVMAKVQGNADFKMNKQPVSQADMRLWLIRLRQEWPQKKEEKIALTRVQLEKALGDEPKNPAVVLGLIYLDGKPTPAQARAAVEGAPKDFRGWYTLGNLSTDPKEKEMALRKSVELGTECAGCNNNLAWFLVTTGRAKEALTFANRALDLAPWDAAAVDTLAEIALQLGQCPQALQLQTRAAGMQLQEGDKQEKVDSRLKSIQDRCAGKASSGSK
jgi:tetratricopeptide (TPR) repeat protein